MTMARRACYTSVRMEDMMAENIAEAIAAGPGCYVSGARLPADTGRLEVAVHVQALSS